MGVPEALGCDEGCLVTKPGRIGVIDVGSNSSRLVVLDVRERGCLELIYEQRAFLQLARHVDEQRRLRPEAFERVVATVADFVGVARNAAAEDIVVVGTAALREVADAELLAAVIQERFGVTLEILDGAREAHFSFLGAGLGYIASQTCALHASSRAASAHNACLHKEMERMRR